MFIFKFNGFSHPNGTRCGEEYAVEDGVLYFRRGVCASEARYAIITRLDRARSRRCCLKLSGGAVTRVQNFSRKG